VQNQRIESIIDASTHIKDIKSKTLIGPDSLELSQIVAESADVNSSCTLPGPPQNLHQSTEERLASLAARHNTYIDNPYQSSHINRNWTKE